MEIAAIPPSHRRRLGEERCPDLRRFASQNEIAMALPTQSRAAKWKTRTSREVQCSLSVPAQAHRCSAVSLDWPKRDSRKSRGWRYVAYSLSTALDRVVRMENLVRGH